MPPPVEWAELGRDELDRQLSHVPAGRRWLPRRRPALGVGATAAPTLLFVVLGAALGPAGLNVLTSGVVVHLQSVVWVALAVIGVFIGLGVAAMAGASGRGTVGTGLLAAAITITTVAGGLYVLFRVSGFPLPGDPLAASLLVGVCASVSAALQTTPATSAELRKAARLADLDDLPLLVVGVALVTTMSGGSILLRLGATIAAGGAIGVAGWLLFERAHEAERGVFVAGAVLLLAGVGAYLGTSPLLSGCVAALVWVRAPGAADRITARDLSTLQHPLVALLLVIAGAMITWSAVVLWVTGCLVVLRFAAKLLAGLTAARLARLSPALLAVVLLHPGVMGIALALNAALLGEGYRWVVSSVTAAVVVSEVLAAFLPAHDEAAS